MRSTTPSKWKIAGAGVAAAALGAVGMIAVGADEADPADADTIGLREQTSTTELDDAVTIDAQDDDQPSPDGESLDSPLQSADDSPEGADSVDTPGDAPSVDSPDAPAQVSVYSPASVDSP